MKGKGAVVQVDMAKIEARVLAAYGMPLPTDPHKKYAAELFGIPESAVTPEQRQFAKRRRYLEMYGGPVELFDKVPLSTAEAGEALNYAALEVWHELHAQLGKFWNRLASIARRGRF